MRRSILTLALLAMLALLAASAEPAYGAGALVVRTTITPEFVYFGDTVTARVDVFFNPARVRASSVQVDPVFGLWSQLTPARTSSAESGGLERRTWTFSLDCVTIACLPRGTSVQAFPLPPVKVTAQSVAGSVHTVSAVWPTLSVAGHYLPPANGNVRPALRLQTGAPAPGYAFDPSSLALTLDVVAAILVLGALALGVRELLHVAAGRRAGDSRSALARALALVRQAQRRDVDDRRRAVGLLARALPAQGEPLSTEASALAWSKPQPTAEGLEAIARKVEATEEES